MQFQIQVDGPSVHRSFTLHASSAPLIVGRDASASIHLPDPEKSISRKHVSLQYEQSSPPAILATVVSTVSSVASNHGELAPGQKVLLRSGDSLQIGPFTLSFSEIARAGAVTPASSADDPFAALGLGEVPSSGRLDPFQQPEFRVTKAPGVSAGDPFESLMGASNMPARAPSSFSGSTGPIAPVPAGDLSVDPMRCLRQCPAARPPARSTTGLAPAYLVAWGHLQCFQACRRPLQLPWPETMFTTSIFRYSCRADHLQMPWLLPRSRRCKAVHQPGPQPVLPGKSMTGRVCRAGGRK